MTLAVERALHQLLIERKESLALAESCTGGFMSAALTQIPGASNYLWGSLIVYSNDAKTRLLGVSEDALAKWSAVSREVVEEMAIGVQRVSGADWGVAVTGYAGSNESRMEISATEPERRIVWGAIIDKKRELHSFLVTFEEGSSRQELIVQVGRYLFKQLLQKMSSPERGSL